MSQKGTEKRIAIVTGAAKGIGLGITEKLCENGFYVMLLGRGLEVMDETKRLISEGFAVEGYICDITNASSIKETVEKIIALHGTIDVLVNNAGVAKIKPFEETDEALLDFHMDVNIKGTWHMTKEVIPYMKAARYGRIINISSVTGAMVCDKGYAAYGMTKAALIGLTKAVAVEYAQYGITCNAICPGFILTPNVKRSAATTNPDNPQEVLDKIAAGVPMKALGTPRQVGALAAFLAGEEAGYITGTANVIDGGNMLPETNVMGLT